MRTRLDQATGRTGAVPDATARRHEIRVDDLNEPISHYTDAVVYGPFVFISGCAPVDASGRVVSEDVREQARQVFLNMRQVLDRAGCDPSDILKVTVYLTDVGDREAVNEARREFFGQSRPASTLIGVAELAIAGMKVEVEAVAGMAAEARR